MSNYNKITALYSRLSVGDEDRDGGESNSIQNQKIFLENYAKGQHLTNIRHYIDDDESGRFFDRSAYSRMIEDVESGKIGVCIMKDLTRWGRDYLQVGNAMEIFRRNNVRFIAVNNGIDSENPDTFAEQYPDECCKTDTDPETGCMEFDIAKGRFSFRLTAPYSEERRQAARQYARENTVADRLK